MHIRGAIVFIEVDGGLRTMGLVFHKSPYQGEGNEGRRNMPSANTIRRHGCRHGHRTARGSGPHLIYVLLPTFLVPFGNIIRENVDNSLFETFS